MLQKIHIDPPIIPVSLLYDNPLLSISAKPHTFGNIRPANGYVCTVNGNTHTQTHITVSEQNHLEMLI